MVKIDVPSYWLKSLLQFFHKFFHKFSHRMFSVSVFIQGRNVLQFWHYLENIPLLKLLLITMVNGLLKTFADNFISFGGILSIPVYSLLSIFLKSCSTSKAETFGRWLFQVKIKRAFHIFYKGHGIINYCVNCCSSCSS